MPDSKILDGTRLLLGLQQVSQIAQGFSGLSRPESIALMATNGLVEQFNSAFARIWVVEPDRSSLRLIASSGLYTRTNGTMSRVPMGAYKVGKIAQNRVPFLSNNLPEEPWVKDREWALQHQIRGFAGYPLQVGQRVIGVLALFSHYSLESEFLEVLQVLCMLVTVALDAALQKQTEPSHDVNVVPISSLSDHLAQILNPTQLTLVGTEFPLSTMASCLFCRTAEILQELECQYCRLTYTSERIGLEAIIKGQNREASIWQEVRCLSFCLRGELEIEVLSESQLRWISLQIPQQPSLSNGRVRILCSAPLLQMAFTQLAHRAGLIICDEGDAGATLITDQPQQLSLTPRAIWIRSTPTTPVPLQAEIVIDLTIEAEQLRELITLVQHGQTLPSISNAIKLSEREQEVMQLLAQGSRDRDIAQKLHISESTVKFHINSTVQKLKVRNRYQAVYQAALKGWI